VLDRIVAESQGNPLALQELPRGFTPMELGRVADLVSFEPQKIAVYLDGPKLELEPGQTVVPHGIDRAPDPDEILRRGTAPAPV
jgi:hypothetical protein